jgi:hypothetical protein
MKTTNSWAHTRATNAGKQERKAIESDWPVGCRQPRRAPIEKTRRLDEAERDTRTE